MPSPFTNRLYTFRSWSGTPIFAAKAILKVPEDVSLDVLQANLEALAGDLLVDVEFRQG